MKYMGSKRSMLSNGLGEVIEREIETADRFIDLFSGSAAVSIYAAQRGISVRAIDTQNYSAILAGSVIHRTRPFSWQPSWRAWFKRATTERSRYRVPRCRKITQKLLAKVRVRCGRAQPTILRSYGGHYFSPQQAIWIDALRATIPKRDPGRSIALAALVSAASRCAASPGHTAQPFQPTRNAKRFLIEAWSRDVIEKTKKAFKSISNQHAQTRGWASVADANRAAKKVQEGDLVFIDLPYSGVHYSRFYHVLETIARGECGVVDGVGRYPPVEERPWSRYSVSTESKKALSELFETVSVRSAKTIVTFPTHKCSNGLSGRIVRNLAKKYFDIEEQKVKSRFSSLGGTGINGNGPASRAARMRRKELILVLKPKDRGA